MKTLKTISTVACIACVIFCKKAVPFVNQTAIDASNIGWMFFLFGFGIGIMCLLLGQIVILSAAPNTDKKEAIKSVCDVMAGVLFLFSLVGFVMLYDEFIFNRYSILLIVSYLVAVISRIIVESSFLYIGISKKLA